MNKLEQDIKNNPAAAKIALDILARGKRPPGWSKRSSSPYYNERAANELKVSLDDMLENGQDMLFPINDGRQRSIHSLYLRINQAFRFLMDYKDPNGIYAQLNERIRIRRMFGIGVKLELIDGADAVGLPRAKVARNPINRLSWKDAVESYIENAKVGDDPLLIENIVLMPSQIQELKDSMLGISGFIYSVTAKSIKIVRINDDKPAA